MYNKMQGGKKIGIKNRCYNHMNFKDAVDERLYFRNRSHHHINAFLSATIRHKSAICIVARKKRGLVK